MSATGNIIFNMVVQGASQASKAFQNNQKSITALTAAFTALSGVVAKQSYNAFVKFEAAMRNVQSVTLDTEQAFQQMSEQVKGLTLNNLNSTATEAAIALYDVRSAGIDASRAMETLDVITQTSAATLADQADVAKIVTGTMNAYGQEFISASKVSNLFVKTIQEGVTTGGELSASLGNITKLAASANVSFEDLTAAVALMTKSGIKTAETMTGLKAAISGIIKPSEDAKKVAEALGIQFNADALKDFPGLMRNIMTATGGNIEVMTRLFPSVEALNAALVLGSKNGKDYAEQSERMRSADDARTSALDKQNKSIQANTNQLSRAFDLLKTEIGGLIGQAMLPLIKYAKELLTDFLNLDKETREVFIIVGGLTAALTPLAFGLRSVGIAVKTIPFMLAVAGIATIIAEVKKLNDVINDTLRLREELNQKTIDTAKRTKEASQTIAELTKKTELNNAENKRLAQAYRTIALNFEQGSKKRKEYIALSDKYSKAIVKETVETKDNTAAANNALAILKKLDSQKNNNVTTTKSLNTELNSLKDTYKNLSKTVEDEINTAGMNSYQERIYFINKEYAERIAIAKKLGEDTTAIEQSHQLKILAIVDEMETEKSNIAKRESDKRNKIAEKEAKEQKDYIDDNYNYWVEQKEKQIKQEQDRFKTLTSEIGNLVTRFTDIDNGVVRLGQSIANDLMTGSLDPLTVAIKGIALITGEMAANMQKAFNSVSEAGVKTFDDFSIAAFRFLHNLNPLTAILGLFGIDTDWSTGMMSGEQSASVKKAFDTIDKFAKEAANKAAEANKAERKALQDRNSEVKKMYEMEKDMINDIFETQIDIHEKEIANIDKQIEKWQEQTGLVDEILNKRAMAAGERQQLTQQLGTRVAGVQDEGFYRQDPALFEAEQEQRRLDLERKFNEGEITEAKLKEGRAELSVLEYAYLKRRLAATRDIGDRNKLLRDMQRASLDFQENAIDREVELAREKENTADKEIYHLQQKKQTEMNNISDLKNAQITAINQLNTAYESGANVYLNTFKNRTDSWVQYANMKVGSIGDTIKTKVNSTLEALRKQESAVKSAQATLSSAKTSANKASQAATTGTFDPVGSEYQSMVLGRDISKPDITSAAKSGLSWLKSFPRYSKGGITDNPVLAGESGTEMILNKRQMSNLFNMINRPQLAATGAAGGIIVNFNGSINASNPNEAKRLVNMVANELSNRFKRQI